MTVEFIAPITNSESLSLTPVQPQVERPSSPMLQLLSHVDSSVAAGNEAIVDYINGENTNTHELMITLEKAKHNLQVTVEVRNKLVEAYESITRMRI